ncbi:MAG TPA: restriction endonuclease subunit S [Planctomycetota bacterium]|nr:restriction endonuclease subunit S [Planctomycetota bacterium]
MSSSFSLPVGWAQIPLEEVVDIRDDLREPINASKREQRQGPYPYYGATGQVGWIDDYLIDGEYVLLGEDGAPFFDASKAKAYIVRGKGWVNNHAHVLIGLGGVLSNRYLLHALNRVDYRGFANGTTRLKLTQAAMRKIPLLLAPPGEQERIVAKTEEIFSDLDAGVAALERAKANLIRYRAAVLRAAVEGKLTAEWRMKHPDVEPASKLLEHILAERRRKWEQAEDSRYAATGKAPPKNWRERYEEPIPPDVCDLPELPKGWCWTTLDSLMLSLGSGTATTATSAPTSRKVLRSSAVRQGNVDLEDYRFLPEDAAQNSDPYLQAGDILITRLSGSLEYVGNCAIVPDIGDSHIEFPDRIFRGRSSSAISKEYLQHCFCDSGLRRPLERKAKSTAGHQRISLSDLRSFCLPLPPRPEQLEIANEVGQYLAVADRVKAYLEQGRRRSTSLRQAILKHAFDGKLVPQDPNDEPVSRLIERIKAERVNTEPKKVRTPGRRSTAKDTP